MISYTQQKKHKNKNIHEIFYFCCYVKYIYEYIHTFVCLYHMVLKCFHVKISFLLPKCIQLYHVIHAIPLTVTSDQISKIGNNIKCWYWQESIHTFQMHFNSFRTYAKTTILNNNNSEYWLNVWWKGYDLKSVHWISSVGMEYLINMIWNTFKWLTVNEARKWNFYWEININETKNTWYWNEIENTHTKLTDLLGLTIFGNFCIFTFFFQFILCGHYFILRKWHHRIMKTHY